MNFDELGLEEGEEIFEWGREQFLDELVGWGGGGGGGEVELQTGGR